MDIGFIFTLKPVNFTNGCRDGNVSLEAGWLVGQSVSPPLWSRLKYLNNYWMDKYDI